ncbi:MAG: hypothetical protein KJ057_11250 [Phycisphaerae bacterium]|nr:MAG: hypothetical protein EDS66_02740 [Planctomycetota bacterium]KAB2949057.1 MAG: hypothetical protein F9K17_04235 [Phycisphaerae bacterium]MBE7457087.1 hypothetical protein [Planctomycetia bacterium]MCK6463555.1 hypothetical protein [Phycisphaerae bacterium]MCL4719036.1 hypothetical protein [Phycisphaerae bacterium]
MRGCGNILAVAVPVFCAAALTVSAGSNGNEKTFVAPTLSLAAMQDEGTVVAESTTVTTYTSGGMRGITGPIQLRVADAMAPGTVDFKNVFGWRTLRGNGDDDFSYAAQIEWGMVENHTLLIHLDDLHLGDGRIDGNGDVTIGWHWKLWNEDGGVPATAIRNFVRIPTGDGSEGVDYELRGLMTWTVSDNARFSINPWLRSVNGENDAVFGIDEDGERRILEDPRHFRWGITAGMDYDLSDDFKLIWDYVYSSSVHDGHRDNHSVELGFDWHFAENQSFNFVTDVSVDGDSNDNASLGAKFSYVVSFGG